MIIDVSNIQGIEYDTQQGKYLINQTTYLENWSSITNSQATISSECIFENSDKNDPCMTVSKLNCDHPLDHLYEIP